MDNNKAFLRNLLLLAVTAVLIFFGWTLFFGRFFSDDFTWVWHGAKIDGDILKILTYKMSSFYSPVLNTFYSVLYSLVGYQYWVYFAAGLVVHALVAFFSGVLIFQYTQKRYLSYLIVPLIAIAGTAYEPVVWVASNLHSIAALFILISVVSYKQYLSSRHIFYVISCFVSLALALLTKEIAVITGVLLVTVLAFEYFEKKIRFSKVHLGLIFSSCMATVVYIYYQYLWQKNSLTVNENWWSLTPQSFLKIPLSFIDQVIPLSPMLAPASAILLFIFSLGLLTALTYKFRESKTILFGLTWGLITVLPTIFFQTEYWWNVLASRYTYLPRIGLLLALVVILDNFFKNKKQLVLSVVILALMQASFAGYIIYQEYPFVYRTGDTLIHAIDKAVEQGKTELLFSPVRPFENNPAHIVGAVETRSELQEEDIIFLEKSTIVNLEDYQALIYWDKKQARYLVSFK